MITGADRRYSKAGHEKRQSHAERHAEKRKSNASRRDSMRDSTRWEPTRDSTASAWETPQGDMTSHGGSTHGSSHYGSPHGARVSPYDPNSHERHMALCTVQPFDEHDDGSPTGAKAMEGPGPLRDAVSDLQRDMGGVVKTLELLQTELVAMRAEQQRLIEGLAAK